MATTKQNVFRNLDIEKTITLNLMNFLSKNLPNIGVYGWAFLPKFPISRFNSLHPNSITSSTNAYAARDSSCMQHSAEHLCLSAASLSRPQRPGKTAFWSGFRRNRGVLHFEICRTLLKG